MTGPVPVPLVPEVRLHLATEVWSVWRSPDALPFWAFAWAGGQALSRYVLDTRESVAGRRVLDLGCGSGLVGIAAALAGAARVVAVDVDPQAVAATRRNAELNSVPLDVRAVEPGGGDLPEVDVVLAGDLFYDAATAQRALERLSALRAAGARVLVGDPGRPHLPRERLRELAGYDVPVVADLEDAAIKRTTVWALDR